MPAGTDLQAWAIALSLGLHSCLAGTLAATRGCSGDAEPLFDPDDVMMIEMAALPKSAGRLPDRASRAPRPADGAPEAMTQPQQPSDQMRFEDPDKEKEKGEKVEDHSLDRERLLAEARRKALVDSLSDAPIGDADRQQTDPDSTLDATFGFGGATGPVDPEAARYLVELRQVLLPLWNPLPKVVEQNPAIFTLVDIWLDPDGRIADSEVQTPSGNGSFDQACLTAVARARRLPIPPARFKVETRKGIQIRVSFRASDARL